MIVTHFQGHCQYLCCHHDRHLTQSVSALHPPAHPPAMLITATTWENAYDRINPQNVNFFLQNIAVCLFSGPATEDKHFLWLFISFQLVLSTSWVLVALTEYQKAYENVKKRKVKVGFEAFTSNAMVAIWNIDLAEMRSPAEF